MTRFVKTTMLLVLVSACSPEEDGSDMASAGAAAQAGRVGFAGAGNGAGTGSGGFGGAEPAPIPPRECKPGAENPTFTLSGTVCGTSIEYTAPEGTRILISHTSTVQNVNVFTVADTDDFTHSVSQDFLRTHDLSFHVNTQEGMEFAVGESTLMVSGGSADICGIGTIGFKPDTPMNAAFEFIEEDNFRAGLVRVRISNLRVHGVNMELGASRVFLCESEGELTAVFDGEYERVR